MVPAESAPAATPSPDAAGLLSIDWLTAWLGQTGEAPELPDDDPEPAAEPATSPAPVAFLTLYPSVPMLPPAESPEPAEAAEPVDDPTAPAPLPALLAPPVSTPAPQPDAAPVNPAVPAPVPVPVDTAPPAPVLSESPDATRQDSTDSSRRGNTFRSADPLPPPPSPAEPVPDRGEIIWNAELVVSEPASSQPTVAEPVRLAQEPSPRQPATNPKPLAANLPPVAEPPREEATPAAAPNDDPAPAIPTEPVSRDAGDAPDPRQSHSEDREPAPRHTPATHAPESPVAAPDRPRFDLHPSAPAHSSSEPVAEVAAPHPVEPARPLRPAQVATVRVDLPNDTLPADTPALRLTVTQRGDQVNVQLRSWDSAATPIEGHRMESLLHSLADQGYVERSQDTPAIDVDLTAVTEGVRERAPLIEHSDLADTRQSFQNHDERQQQNQERQQQQQANFLRRQLRNSRNQSFEFQPVQSEAPTFRY